MRSRKHQLLLLWCHFQTVSSPKKAQRNYIDVIHPSIHSSLGGQGSNKKTSTNTTPPILAGFSWKKQKTGYHFFFYQRSLSGAIYGLMFADGNQLLQLLLRYPTSSATSIQEASRQLHGRWRVEQKSGWNYWKWWENMKQIDRGRLSRLMGGCRD